MASVDAVDETDAPDAKSSGKKGLLIGLVLAVAAGAGGFYAVSSGLILGGESSMQAEEMLPDLTDDPLPDIEFVPLEAITVSLGPASGAAHLRFRGQLEVPKGEEQTVANLSPRIVDVLNAYLRAVEPAMLEQSDILTRLRAQMLRRIRLVVGENRVRDLLIMEFILK
ncbi:flagellar basal body-associated FliL family protein [Maribius pontilimi]|uniref:Flagellar protein FliL n=1 Tax=Palleronia pontilimi TaxID=1964209 RepID=A0A934ICL7_9RHOB|nr:flagellar basal body-associated FliL family protein [Palleronia pontilimi]MBJ3763191.1 flagellar basal body-associated FliL family protein [Palleronia pontilimi]